MKIRTKFLLSYLSLVLFFILFGTLIRYYIVYDITRNIIESSISSIERLLKLDKNLIDEILVTYAEEGVEKRAQGISQIISSQITKNKEYTIEKIKKDKLLRKIATQNILAINGSNAGYAHMYDDRGLSIFHPIKSVEGRNFSIWAKKYPQLYSLIRKSFKAPIVSGYYEFFDTSNNSISKYMVSIKIPNTHFIIAVSVSLEEFFRPVELLLANADRKMINEINKYVKEVAKSTSDKIRTANWLGAFMLLLIGALFSIWLSNSMSKPIRNLCEKVKKLGSGDFTTSIPEKGLKEIVELAHCFNELGEKLHLYMENLKKEVAAREAIDCEMKIARTIQNSLIPKDFPVSRFFELYAILNPAKEVSGDFFDYFFVRDDTLALIIGDVSGKSIPAALFMAHAINPIRYFCGLFPKDPSRVLKETNKLSYEKNEACMFVTVFMAYYNINTGRIIYANAGHDEMIHLKPDGSSSLFGCFSNPPLGIKPDLEYKTGELILKRGRTSGSFHRRRYRFRIPSRLLLWY